MADAEAAARRRYRAQVNAFERAGAAEDVSRLCVTLVQHIEQHCQVRVEQAERAAIIAVVGLVLRNLSERAGRDWSLAEVI